MSLVHICVADLCLKLQLLPHQIDEYDSISACFFVVFLTKYRELFVLSNKFHDTKWMNTTHYLCFFTKIHRMICFK